MKTRQLPFLIGSQQESGQIMLLLAVTVILSLIMLLFFFTFLQIVEVRTENQIVADLAALAGANRLSQGLQANRAIAFAIWSRNTVLDSLYLAASIVSLGSAGLATEVFAIPRMFQRITAPVIEKLEQAEEPIAKAAVVTAVKDGVSIGKANGIYGNSLAVPVPLWRTQAQKSQRQLDLERLIKMYAERIEQAQAELEIVLKQYYELKTKAEAEPGNQSYQEKLQELDKEVKEKAGRLGGLTRWKNQREKELAELKVKETLTAGGEDGVIGFVWGGNKNLSVSTLIGKVNSGAHISIAGAQVIDSQTNQIIGEQALLNLSKQVPGLNVSAQGFYYVLKTLSLFSDKSTQFLSQFGLLNTALGKLISKVLPPNIKAAKPALAPVSVVLKEEDKLASYLEAAKALLGN